ncbi:MAG: hypothetical protein FJ291_21820 [Planctomycetes bacterium]|nr:hypothetical protein [Planctomycetota bacterium]
MSKPEAAGRRRGRRGQASIFYFLLDLIEFWPPARKQLTAEWLKVAEEVERQGCKVNWTE